MTSLRTSLLTDRVRDAFSEAADRYDRLSGLQQAIASQLAQQLQGVLAHQRILDVGTGTGYLAQQIQNSYPQAMVIGIDFAEGMMHKAFDKDRQLRWLAADAKYLPFKKQGFDWVVSNLAYQWVNDLPRAFSEAHRVLVKEGRFVASLFGQQTCNELFVALSSTGVITDELNRLLSVHDVQESMNQAGFSAGKIDSEKVVIKFKDLWQLLGWLKATGSNRLSSGKFLGLRGLKEANAYCLKHYPCEEGIGITFEIIWIQAHA